MANRLDDGFSLIEYYVKDWAGNIQAGHKTKEDALRHASSEGMAAYESVTVVRRLDKEAS